MDRLKDKVVIITNSSSSIDEATAILFSKFGSKIVITGRKEDNLNKLAKLCEDVSPSKYKPLSVVGDLNDDGFQATLINSTITLNGQLDILVNCAVDETLPDILSDDFPKAFDNVLKVNLRLPVMLTRLALPHLIKSKGCVVNVSCPDAFRSVSDDALPHHMSKIALDSMTTLLVNEFGPKGLRVISISPEVIKTSIKDHVKNLYDKLAKKQPLGKHESAEDIANVICLMASSGASLVTGTTLVVEGGQSTPSA